jgi:hypothetical protein
MVPYSNSTVRPSGINVTRTSFSGGMFLLASVIRLGPCLAGKKNCGKHLFTMERFPQRIKPDLFCATCGTTKVVP